MAASSDDEAININQKNQQKKPDPESSDDDNVAVTALVIKEQRKNKAKNDSESEDEPLVSKTINKQGRSTSSNESRSVSTSNNNNKKKRNLKSRFVEDEEGDDSSDDESSDVDKPIVAASIIQKAPQKPPKKKRKLKEGSSPTPKKPIKKTRKSPKKSDEKQKPGYIGREVNASSKYEIKKDIRELHPDKNAIKWWDRLEDLWNTQNKWNTLDHNGVVFPPPYEPHNVKMLYNNKEIDLTPDQEEIATMFAVLIETDWAKKKPFKDNFMKEFRAVLTDKHQKIQHSEITDISKCNFEPIRKWYFDKKEEEKELKKDDDYKEKLKQQKAELDSKYGWAIVDGVREKVANYKVEPPGLFRGRGEHPKMGKLKKRLQPEDIILNIGKNTPIPPCPIPGRKWGGVIHDQSVTYIAKWVENINGQSKMVYLHASSRFKGQSDFKKFQKARELKKHVKKIREDYESRLRSNDPLARQLATAIWIIDHLSIRVGNEKDTDEEADTVGVCSLRLEHITFEPEGKKITLDFLGKDSMRYRQTIALPDVIYENLKMFCKNKKSDQDIFEKIDSNKVNDYLKNQMEGLTAKVFRTHNASVCLQDELSKNVDKKIGEITADSPLPDKIFFYNQCNMQVAILCNHQKSVSKSHAAQLEKIDQQMEECREKIAELEELLEVAEGRKKLSEIKKRKSPKKNKKNNDGENEDENENENENEDEHEEEEGDEEENKPKRLRNPESIRNQIRKKKELLRKRELSKQLKEDHKEVALGTSKINYMDPRITVAWCKKMEVPIERIFNKSLLDKFPWAMGAPPDYEF